MAKSGWQGNAAVSAEVPDDIVALGKYGRHPHRNPILNSAVVSIKPANLETGPIESPKTEISYD